MQPTINVRLRIVAVAWLVAACSVATPPSDAPAPSTVPAPTSSTSLATQAPTDSAAPTPQGPTGGGLLVVYQLDAVRPEDTDTTSVFTVDVGTGERRDIATLDVTEQTCCPSEVHVSSDRGRAFLFGVIYVGVVDLITGDVTLRPNRAQGFNLLASNAGDRVAWLNQFSGTEESIVLGGLDGTETGQVELPATAWQTQFAWSPDDTAFAIATILTIPGLSFPERVARCCGTPLGVPVAQLACCTPDHGVTASHLMIVPLNGGGIQDLVNDEALVRHDLEVPNPTVPPDMTTNATLEPERRISQPVWAPDGGSVAYVQSTCEVTFNWREDDCVYQLRIVDVADRSDRLVVEGTEPFGGVAWSPSGDHLAYQAEKDANTFLFVVDPAGGDSTLLSDTIGNIHWSPDGTWLSFERINDRLTEGDRADLWAMPLTGGKPRLIAPHAAGGW